jgi:hypothetical protein
MVDFKNILINILLENRILFSYEIQNWCFLSFKHEESDMKNLNNRIAIIYWSTLIIVLSICTYYIFSFGLFY